MTKKKNKPSNQIKPAKKRKSARVYFLVSTGSVKQDDMLICSDNISLDGVFLETVHPLPVGTKVKLRFPLKSTWEPIQVEGKVLWSRKELAKGILGNKMPGMGIAFEKIKKKDLKVLKEFLDQTPTYGWFLES